MEYCNVMLLQNRIVSICNIFFSIIINLENIEKSMELLYVYSYFYRIYKYACRYVDNQRMIYNTHAVLYPTSLSALCMLIPHVSFKNRDGKFATQYNLLKRPCRNLLWSTLDFHRFVQKPDRDRGDGR